MPDENNYDNTKQKDLIINRIKRHSEINNKIIHKNKKEISPLKNNIHLKLDTKDKIKINN